MRERWKDVAFPPPYNNQEWDDQTHQQIRQNYAAMIENIDQHVGEFLAYLQERGEADRTLVVYSSDHGEMLGDHGLWGKSTFFQPALGIPLVVTGPDVQQGRRSDALVMLHDLAATFLDYAEATGLPNVDSQSLRPLLVGQQTTHRQFAIAGLDNWAVIFDGRYKLIQVTDTAPMLFDLQTDPLENNNFAPTAPHIVNRLQQMLEQTRG